MNTYSVICKCGYRCERIESNLSAQVIADRHESGIIRRAYQHETSINAEAK
jgi:hypothetical protein